MPYRLYALSNLASMLALVTYPVLIEPRLSVGHQTTLWSGAHVCFSILAVIVAWRSLWGVRPATGEAAASAPPRWGARVSWVALAGCASVLLLAITSHLTQDVAAIPFLWVLPLSIYLASFILCFEAPWLHYRPVYFPLLVLALAGMGYKLYWSESSIKVPAAIALGGAALFIFCMFCHGELARSKPTPRHLTVFYVMVSIGGALGGLVLCAALAVAILLKDNLKPPRTRWAYGAAAASVLLLCTYGWALAKGAREMGSDCRVVARNFYGTLRVYDEDMEDGSGEHRKLMHGVINHGEQVLSERYRRRAATYYCPGTGIGDVLSGGQPGAARRIGLLGLGCGTLTAYGRPGDVFRIYEINPLVLRLARTEFTYLADTPARVETVLGDARLELEREPDQHFDVLIMDAFSGDSVPVHLLTREAFQTYLRHLKPGGIVAVNTSNRYLDLRPVIERAATYFGKLALSFQFTPQDDDPVCFGASWVLVVDPQTRQAFASELKAGKPLEPHPGFRMWTDDYSGMFGILK